MDPFMVLLNGEEASFADMIAPLQMDSSKPSTVCKDLNDAALLNSKDEPLKMGLLECSPFAKKLFACSLCKI